MIRTLSKPGFTPLVAVTVTGKRDLPASQADLIASRDKLKKILDRVKARREVRETIGR